MIIGSAGSWQRGDVLGGRMFVGRMFVGPGDDDGACYDAWSCLAASDQRRARSRFPSRNAIRQRCRACQAWAAMRISARKSDPQREHAGLPRKRAPQTGQLKIGRAAASFIAPR